MGVPLRSQGQRRYEGTPAGGIAQGAIDIAWKAQVRLCGRYRKLLAGGKKSQVAVTAIARELLGFVWAIARSVAEPAVPMGTVQA